MLLALYLFQFHAIPWMLCLVFGISHLSFLFMIKNTVPIAELKGRVYFRTKGQTSSKMACDPCLWCSRPCVASVLCGPAFWVPQKGWHIISEARTLKRCWPPLQAEVFSYSVCGLGGSLQPQKETTPQGDQSCGQSLPSGSGVIQERLHMCLTDSTPHRGLEYVDLRTTEYTVLPYAADVGATRYPTINSEYDLHLHFGDAAHFR